MKTKTLTLLAGAAMAASAAVGPANTAAAAPNIQIQLGVDIDEDNTVDRYVNPGDGVYDPDDAAYVPGARVLSARFWIDDQAAKFRPGNFIVFKP